MNEEHTSKTLKALSPLNNFSHIYVEEQALTFADAQAVLQKFPKARRVLIRDYKEIFNRPRQSWQLQKRSRKLILALKKEGFIYQGSGIAQNFAQRNFYYNALVQNCLFDCSYCYLQGMYPSAGIVMYVNGEDFIGAAEVKLRELGSLYICISYDTDLLAFEDILPHCKRWIEFAAREPKLLIEIRTKSVNYGALKHLKPVKNVILAWTLSPPEVAERYEFKTPSPGARIMAAEQAIKDGWRVRLCFDPLLRVDGWHEIYRSFVAAVFSRKSFLNVSDVSVGAFRMGQDYFRRFKRQGPHSDLLYREYETQNGVVTYPSRQRDEIVSNMAEFIGEFVSAERIHVA